MNIVIEYLRFTQSELKIKNMLYRQQRQFLLSDRENYYVRARFLRQNSDVPILSHKMMILKMNSFLQD